MQFSILRLLSAAIDDGNLDPEYLPLAKRFASGVTQRIQCEVDKQINHTYQGQALLLKMFSAASSVDRLKLVQDARRDLGGDKGNLNDRISRSASKLAELLREREAREREAHLSAVAPIAFEGQEAAYIYGSVVALIDRAAELGSEKKRVRYSQDLRPSLANLEYRFDDKYWPSQADLVDALACFADERRYLPSDASGMIADSARQRNAASDFVRLLDDAFAEIRGLSVGCDAVGEVFFPEEFELTNECLADLIQVFDFGEKSVKEVRQYRRLEN